MIVVVCLVAVGGCDRGAEAPTSPLPKSSAGGTYKSRAKLRATLRQFILGELRLAKNDHEAILEACREIYLEDPCPENERSTFIQFAADELKRAEAQLESEKSVWPAETDCDRLDRVEAALRQRGILLWQVSPCCDTCTTAELPDRIDVIDRRHPGFRARVRGYAFFIEQNLRETLSESTKLSVYLGYGWLSPDNSKAAADIYEKNALGIAREVCKCLRDEGLEVDWDGDFSRKIGLSINWQRRRTLD
jgi:hypothetical protein